jgi:predicted dehydrogenase
MQKRRIAIIGLGWIGYHHAQLAMASEEFELVAVSDPCEAARTLALQLDRPIYSDYLELLNSQQLDAVVVATPTGLHVPVGIECAQAGLHLLVEKPIADGCAEALRLVEAAETSGVQLLVGHYRRFNRAVEAARDLVQSGRIGRLVGVSGLWALFKEPAYFEPEWRRKPGAGPVLTNLIHDIDCLRYICGEIRSVQSITSTAVRGHQVEDSAAVILQFSNGALGTFLVSDAALSPWGYEAATGDNPDLYASGENCVYFVGSEGCFAFPELRIWRNSDPQKIGWRHPIQPEPRSEELFKGEFDPFAAQLSHFRRVIDGLEPPRVNGRDGLQSLAVTRAVLEAGNNPGLVVAA